MQCYSGRVAHGAAAFHSRRLREVVLTQPAQAVFALSFSFSDGDVDAVAATPEATEAPDTSDPTLEPDAPQAAGTRIIPAYVLVEEPE